jgi:Bacterial pre-peptidase C-terminal domain
MRRIWSCWCVFVAMAWGAMGVCAQPVPVIASASTDTVQRGKTVSLTLSGENLGGANRVLLLGSGGVEARLAASPPATRPSDVKALTVSVTTAADAPRGVRELRVVTPSGVTKPLTIFVDDLEARAEKEPNDSPSQATLVALPGILVGKMDKELDVDHFSFAASKGQRLIFDMQAFRFGSKLDGSMSVLDSAGKRLAHDEDTNGLDPFIDFLVPADGVYALRVQDLQYKGGADYGYRIRAGELPHVDGVFPLGWHRGGHVELRVFGRNLGAATKMNMALDGSDAGPMRRIEVPTALGLSNARMFAVSDLPEIAEADSQSANPSEVTPPVVINGRISKENETDTYRFKCPAAGPVVLEVGASRFGSRLDALLTLMDDKGAVIARNDDAPGSGADARLEFAAEKDKVYRVSVRDLVGRGGDDYAYRLSIAPARAPRPDFDVTLRYEEPLRLNRGAKTKLWASVNRKGGFNGDVSVVLSPLPEGVTCRPLRVSATQPSSGVFTLSAAEDAPVGFYPLGVVASGAVGDEVISKTLAADGRLGAASPVYLSVHDAAPFRIERVGPPTTAPVDPKLKAEQIASLEKLIGTQTPQLDEAQAKWEKSLNAASAWEVVDVVEASAASRAKLTKQPDGSLRAEGPEKKPVPAKDKYVVTANALTAAVRAIRLEAIAQGGAGPGRAPNGNFVLSEFSVSAAPLANPAQTRPVELASATATFEQAGFPARDSIPPNTKPDGGWAIDPEGGRSHAATYLLKAPLAIGGTARLVFTLDQNSKFDQHVLARFRLLASGSDNPDDKTVLPSAVLAILRTAPEKRSAEQRAALAAYYRTVAPQLAEARAKLAALKGDAAAAAAFPPVVQARQSADVDVVISRSPGFAGEITLSIEGFSAGIDPLTKQPATIAKDFDVKPLTLKPDQAQAKITLKAKDTPEKGTRDAIIRAEANEGGRKYVVYSGVFPVTVK